MFNKEFSHRGKNLLGLITHTTASRTKGYLALGNKVMHILNGNLRKKKLQKCVKVLRDLKMCHLNVRGSLKGDKFDELELVIAKHDPDFLGVSEINMDERDDVPTGRINYNFIPGYTYSKQKTRVGVFIKRGIVHKVRQDIMDKLKIPCVWVEIKVDGGTIAIVNIYREFKKYKTTDAESSETLQAQKNRFQNFINEWSKEEGKYSEMFVMGDFNIDHRTGRYKPFSDMLEGKILTRGFSQIIKENTFANTRGDISLIDHVYTNAKAIKNVIVDRCMGGTDHSLIGVTRETKKETLRPQYVYRRSRAFYTKSELIYILLGLDLDIIKEEDDPETQVTMLTAAINVAMDVICPEKLIMDKKKHGHWLDGDIKLLIQKRDVIFKNYMKAKKENEKESIVKQHLKEYNEMKNKTRREIAKAKKNYYKTGVNNVKDSKATWAYMNEISGRNPRYKDPIAIVENEIEYTDEQVLASKFNNFYKDKVEKIKRSIDTTQPSEEFDIGARDIFSFNTVTYQEVVKHINSLSNSGAEGLDKISNKIIKDAKWILSPIIANIVNNCIYKGFFPERWKEGKINVTYKKGSRHEMANYRPVTILCSLSKILEKIMFGQITGFLETYGMFDKSQYGFRKGHSTTLALIDYVNSVLYSKEDPENKVNTVFIDLSAAFDLVEHEALLRKMEKMGIGGRALSLLRNYLCNRRVCTEIGIGRSEMTTVDHGVPQGSILGPLLYIIYIYNIQNNDNNRRVIYADDTSTVVVAKNYGDLRERTDSAMVNLTRYYAGIGLKMNPGKTELISHNTSETVMDIGGGVTLRSSKTAKMLGVMIDPQLNFHEHTDSLVKKIKTRLIIFRRLARVADLRARLIFGHGILLSCIQYSVQVWSGTDKKTLRKIRIQYDKCIKAMAGKDYEHLQPAETRKELGILSFSEMRTFFDISTMNRIIGTGTPENIMNQITTESGRDTRTARSGNVKPKITPKTERLNRSFIHRACREYNKIPKELKEISNRKHKEFNKRLKLWLLGLPYETGGTGVDGGGEGEGYRGRNRGN